MTSLRLLYAALDARFPFSRAESWDKTGLLVGDFEASIERVLVAYEVTDAALDAAQKHDCQAVVTYHPLIFRPMEKLDFSDRTARLCARLIRDNRHLICVHTALDGASPPDALGDALARQLGIENARVHNASGVQKLVQIVYFSPPGCLERTREAAWQAGAGAIGRYDEASFSSEGHGTFRPLDGAHPSVGTLGKREQMTEIRVELVAPEDRFPAILKAIQAAHAYEEVACSVFPLLNQNDNQAYGPLRLAPVERADLNEWIERAKTRLNVPSVRVAAPDEVSEWSFVACSPGSGAQFIPSLARGTIFVSGDFKHHDALLAHSRGVALIDVTHAATETASIELMASVLEKVNGVEVVRDRVRNPFDWV